MAASATVRRTRSGIRGRDRKSIRARDFFFQVTDPEAKIMEASPEYDKPKILIETMRILNGDVMTARDKALYELMLATARNNGIEIEWHEIDMRTMTRFLEIGHVEPVQPIRVRESLKRITRTLVSYDFRTGTKSDYGDLPLVLANISEDLLTGAAVVQYSIPAPVRVAILNASAYAMLQLNVFPKFRCRYSGHLYQRLAYYSGLPGTPGKRWEIEPTKLAASLSYPMEDGKLHFASFTRRCLEPALAEISEHVGQFRVKVLKPVRGSGRGRTVEKLVFELSPKEKRIEHMQAAKLSARELDVIGLPDDILLSHELPGTLVVGRVVTATGIPATTLMMGWRAALENAKANLNDEIVPGMQGGLLVSVLERGGSARLSRCGGRWQPIWRRSRRTGFPSFPPRKFPRKPPEIVDADKVDERLSPRLLSMVKIAPTEEGRLAKDKQRAVNGASDILDALRGFYPGGQFKAFYDDEHFTVYCDHEVSPWSNIASHVGGVGALAKALRILRGAESDRRKGALKNLAYAAKKWDLQQIMKIAGAIIADEKAGNIVVRKVSDHRPMGAKGFIPTRQITESCGEYDFADPAYAVGTINWDDRAETDMVDDD